MRKTIQMALFAVFGIIQLIHGQSSVSMGTMGPDNRTDVALPVMLSWTVGIIGGGFSFEFRVSTDSSFSTIVLSGTPSQHNMNGGFDVYSYTDNGSLKANTTYYWQIRWTNGTWCGPNHPFAKFTTAGTTGTVDCGHFLPASSVYVAGNRLHYDLNAASQVELSLYNLMGRKVVSLDQFMPEGKGMFSIKHPGLANGSYILRFRVGTRAKEMRILIEN